jgi:alpha-ketoglutarate-dependent taurine dioxygenase
MGTLSFEPTGGSLGAFVYGLDFDDIDGRALRDALNEYRLLCIRGRVVTDDEHVALASSLGHLAAERAGVVSLVSNVVPGGALGGDEASWHSDFMFFPSPYEYISLYALELPAVLWPHPATGEEVLAVWHQQTDAILPLPQEDTGSPPSPARRGEHGRCV